MHTKESIVSYTLDEIIEKNEHGEVYINPQAPVFDELDEAFWKNARVVMPQQGGKEAVTVRYDRSVLDWFKSTGKRG